MRKQELKSSDEKAKLDREDSRRSFIKKTCATAVAISAPDFLVSAANDPLSNRGTIAKVPW